MLDINLQMPEVREKIFVKLLKWLVFQFNVFCTVCLLMGYLAGIFLKQ